MIDYLEEIWATLRQNKLRAVMTGFSVAWGIFMLLILLGAGRGLENGMANNFRGVSQNAIWVHSGQTSESYRGLGEGRRIELTNDDYAYLKEELAGIDNISGRVYLRGNRAITYKNQYGVYSVTGVHPAYFGVELFKDLEGRLINEKDIRYRRKVIVLTRPIVKILFQDEEPIGQYVKLGGIPFKVVGVFESLSNAESRSAFLPLSTAQTIFSPGNKLGNLAISTVATTVEENRAIEEAIRATLASRHQFSPSDQRALHIWNTLEHFRQAQGIFIGIRLFVWVIGIMTIVAGIVGVSNIMIILVKARTREIGIRKAIGASPWSVVRLVLSESILITCVAGFFGLIAGMGVLHVASEILVMLSDSNPMIERIFYHPSADFRVALSATALLVISGLLAGYVPARRAASIKPIEALHND